MKKRLFVILLCCAMVLFCSCSAKGEKISLFGKKYKRISFNSETLGETLATHIAEDTAVVNLANESFPSQVPIYEIKEREITDEEFQQMEEALGITQWYIKDFDRNEIHSLIAPYTDPVRGYYYTLEMTDEELEELAWETFRKIPFLDGEYVYLGISSTMTTWNSAEGERIASVTVSFRRLLDGVQVLENDRCDFSFDASGLQEMHIALFDYEEIGTMDVVTLDDATARIKTPDAFTIDAGSAEGSKMAETLQVDRIKLLLVNQHSKGCTILQPVYTFIGTALLENGTQAEFSSRIIAIPESYTYESD